MRYNVANKEIIKEIWPDEYEREWGGSVSDRETRYYELRKEYQAAGRKDFNEKAYHDAYGDQNPNSDLASGRISLFMKVDAKLKSMQRLLQGY